MQLLHFFVFYSKVQKWSKLQSNQNWLSCLSEDQNRKATLYTHCVWHIMHYTCCITHCVLPLCFTLCVLHIMYYTWCINTSKHSGYFTFRARRLLVKLPCHIWCSQCSTFLSSIFLGTIFFPCCIVLAPFKLSFQVSKLTISFVSSLELPCRIPDLGLFCQRQSPTKQGEIKEDEGQTPTKQGVIAEFSMISSSKQKLKSSWWPNELNKN